MPLDIAKIPGKFKYEQKRYQSKFLRIYRALNEHIVHVDGGLGSQILQYALYSQLKREGKRTSIDLSYFDSESRNEDEWFVRRPWRLDYFGYSKVEQVAKTRPRLQDEDFVLLYAKTYRKVLNDTLFMNELFPLKDTYSFKELKPLGITYTQISNSIVVHIRQGDYLTAASLLLNEEFYLNALDVVFKRLGEQGHNIIFLSDERIDSQRFPNIYRLSRSKSQRFRVIIGGNDFITHNIMRSCKALICSNSTFSFSAAALSYRGVNIYPDKFYEGRSSVLNEIFKLESGTEVSVT